MDNPVYNFLMFFPMPLRMVVIFAIMWAVVPLAGLLTFGNWRQAWEYSKIWTKVVGSMVLIAFVIALLFL